MTSLGHLTTYGQTPVIALRLVFLDVLTLTGFPSSSCVRLP